MPFAQLPECGAKLWWRSNLLDDDLSLLRSSSKPLMLLIHPVLLSTQFLSHLFEDDILSDAYNLIAFDFICYGQTECPDYISSGKAPVHDTWVDAALIAAFSRALDLPPFHLVGIQINGVPTALRFAILFPKQVLSLVLCQVPTPVDPDWVIEAYSEVVQSWIGASDLETFEEAIGALAYFSFANTISDEEMDEAVEYWQMNYDPTRSLRILSASPVFMTRVPTTNAELARINKPVLILHGDNSNVHPLQHAEELRAALINAPFGGAQLCVVERAPDNMVVPLQFARKVNKYIWQFVDSLTMLEATRSRAGSTDSGEGGGAGAFGGSGSGLLTSAALRRDLEDGLLDGFGPAPGMGLSSTMLPSNSNSSSNSDYSTFGTPSFPRSHPLSNAFSSSSSNSYSYSHSHSNPNSNANANARSRHHYRPNDQPCTVTEADMRRALALQAEMAGDVSIMQRDPLDPWSFSRKPEEAKALIRNIIIPQWTEIENSGLTFLTPEGRPLRKYSERHHDVLFAKRASSPAMSTTSFGSRRDRDEGPPELTAPYVSKTTTTDLLT